MEILHARSICETDQDPEEVIGTSVTTKVRSVVCNDCRRAGEVAAPGYEEEVRQAWATRNGYRVEKTEGGWQVHPPR